MSTQRGWVVWLVLAGVFLAGGVTGGFVSLRVAQSMVQKGRSSDQYVPHYMERLTAGLTLTETQQEQIRVIVDQTWVTLRQYRRSSVEAMRAQETAIMALLDPAQQAAYTEMQAEHRSRWQKLVGRRGPGGRDGEERPSGDRDGERPPPGMPSRGAGGPPPEPPPVN